MSHPAEVIFEYSTANEQVPVGYGRWGAMHTRCEVLLPELARDRAHGLIEQISRQTRAVEALVNRFDPASALARLNREGEQQAVEVEDELYTMLELCHAMGRSTEGYFDVAAASAPHTKGEAMELDAMGRTVRLAKGVQLDLGGFAKGYALERAKQSLRKEGVERALISFGDSSVLGLGTHPLGANWLVGLADPKEDGGTLYTFELVDEALSVSGHASRHRMHIRTPGGVYTSREGFIAVIGPSPLVAEVLSTALFAADEIRWGAILAAHPGYRAQRVVYHTGVPAIITEIV